MDPNRYRLASTWVLNAEPDDVYRTLQDVARYPLWWPEVRQARRLGDRAGELVVRSLLPYELVFRIEEARQAPAEGVLEAILTGDLNGWSRWTVSRATGGTRVVFEEDVRPGKPLMRRLAPAARLAFVANHALMMRSGRRGLQAYLAGYRAGCLEARRPQP
jgi:hypothetical protein